MNRSRRSRLTQVTTAALLAGAVACTGGPVMDPALAESIDLYTGVAGRVDNERAHELLLQAAEDEDPLSLMWIARVHSTGRMGFPEDIQHARSVAEKVIGRIERLAAAEEPEALFLMGTAFAEGLGKPVDPMAAAEWYRRAAAYGHGLASHNLGNIHRDGIGVEQNDSIAITWWLPAAIGGDAIPALRLGEFYETGRGVPVDLEVAKRWYQESARRGNADARRALARLNSGSD